MAAAIKASLEMISLEEQKKEDFEIDAESKSSEVIPAEQIKPKNKIYTCPESKVKTLASNRNNHL